MTGHFGTSHLHEHPASFDKLRMRGNLGGTKKAPHPELVEGRTTILQHLIGLIGG
jgi:hypothetical protein